MDIFTQVEIVLRSAGYETWKWTGLSPSVVCFENASVLGFVHEYGTSTEQLRLWATDQQAVLARHSGALRAAGQKAWNVYSVFLSGDQVPQPQRAVDQIEEDFTLTRKIARCSVRTPDDVERALLPLTRIRAQPLLGDPRFESRLRTRLKDLPEGALAALLSQTRPDDVARILGARA